MLGTAGDAVNAAGRCPSSIHGQCVDTRDPKPHHHAVTVPELPADPSSLGPDDAPYLAELRRRGAVAPSSALAHSELPPIPPSRLALLIDLGVIREGAPGSFYLYERSPFAPSSVPAPTRRDWRDLIKLVIVGVLVWSGAMILASLFA
jgi:hypothetical protein